MSKNLKIITSLNVLGQYTIALRKAKIGGDPELIEKAQQEFDAYHKLCMEADELSLGMTYGALFEKE